MFPHCASVVIAALLSCLLADSQARPGTRLNLTVKMNKLHVHKTSCKPIITLYSHSPPLRNNSLPAGVTSAIMLLLVFTACEMH